MGDSEGVYANELRAMLRPFVFRRYIDFSVIQSLRNMKGMIAREVRRRGLTDNIKLGAGGIRETSCSRVKRCISRAIRRKIKNKNSAGARLRQLA